MVGVATIFLPFHIIFIYTTLPYPTLKSGVFFKKIWKYENYFRSLYCSRHNEHFYPPFSSQFWGGFLCHIDYQRVMKIPKKKYINNLEMCEIVRMFAM